MYLGIDAFPACSSIKFYDCFSVKSNVNKTAIQNLHRAIKNFIFGSRRFVKECIMRYFLLMATIFGLTDTGVFKCRFDWQLFSGLPDFTWYKIPKRENTCQLTTKYTK
jgi:hypothetical protein